MTQTEMFSAAHLVLSPCKQLRLAMLRWLRTLAGTSDSERRAQLNAAMERAIALWQNGADGDGIADVLAAEVDA